MSLRTFHIVFVSVVTLMFAFLAIWAFAISGNEGGMVKVLGVLGLAGIVGMPAYGVYFYRKARNILL